MVSNESFYFERPVSPGLAALGIGCTWEQQTAFDTRQLVIPDGCVDLIWLAGRELVIAGPDTGPREVWLPAGLLSSGVRLRPGAAGGFLGIPAREIRGQQVLAEAVLGPPVHRLIDALEGTEWPERRTLMATWVAARIPPPDPLVVAAAQGLSVAGSRVSEVARDLGISERGLYRRTTAAVGLGPKTLARILRLHRLAQPTTASLAERALAAGYASQAHMSDEVRRLTGQTAVRFLEDRSQMSI